jgi:hypothetical protein
MENLENPGRRRFLTGVGAGLFVAGTGVPTATGQGDGDGQQAAIVSLQNVGSEAWELVTATAGIGADTGTQNPTLKLETGARYAFVNLGWENGHPLAFFDAEGGVLLSQDGDGAFEDDPDVEWVDGRTEIAFTVTDSLAAELSGYRSTASEGMAGGIRIGDESFFELREFTPATAERERGETLDFSATVRNVGDSPGEVTVAAHLDGESVGNRSVELAGGTEQTVTFEAVETDDLEPGEYVHSLRTPVDERTGTLTITERTEPDDATVDDGSGPDDTTDDGESSDDADTDGSGPGFGTAAGLAGLGGATYAYHRLSGESERPGE